MSVIIGKTASRIAQQIRQIVGKANAEFNKEGPPNKKVIQELRKDWKKLNDALPAAEQDEKITPAKDKKPVMERGDVPSLSIGAGEDAYSKGTTPFRPKDEPVSKAVSEGRDTGRKGFAQKKQELTIKGDRSVPFKKGRSKKDDRVIRQYKGKTKKIPEGKAGSFKQPEKTSPLDKQKKQIVSKAKRKLDEGPPDPKALQHRGDKPPFKPRKKVSDPSKSKLARLRKQYEELSKSSDEVVKLLADPNFEKQQRTETQLKKLVGRYTPAQLRELMGASGTDAKTISRDTGIKSRSPKSIDPEEYIASRRGNPLQALIKKKAKPQRYRQIIKNLQNASPKIQRLAVRLGIIGKATIKKQKDVTGVTQQDKKLFKRKTKKPTKKNGQLELSFIPGRDIAEKVKARKASVKKTKKKTTKPYKPKKPEVRAGKPRKINGKTVETTQYRKKGGKVLKTKVKRKTTAPRKRAALRGYGAALRGF